MLLRTVQDKKHFYRLVQVDKSATVDEEASDTQSDGLKQKAFLLELPH